MIRVSMPSIPHNGYIRVEFMASKGFCKVSEIDIETQRKGWEKSNRQASAQREMREEVVIELEVVADPYVSWSY